MAPVLNIARPASELSKEIESVLISTENSVKGRSYLIEYKLDQLKIFLTELIEREKVI